MHRLFVALRPPPDIRRLLGETMRDVPQVRWQDDAQLHLTLRFIGEVERTQAEDIAAALGTVYAPVPELAISGVGRFDVRGRITSLWAGVTPHDALRALHRKVDQALARAAVPPAGRAYLPHITLARLSRSAGGGVGIERWLADHAALASPSFAPSHLMLYESSLGGDGAIYDAVARWALG